MTIHSISVNVLEKERKIVKLLADGNSVPEISSLININRRTLEAMVSSVRTKYKCNNISHLVATFLRNKLID